MKQLHSKKGFTLIELLIVISVISLLAVLGLSSYQSVQTNARNAKRKADLKEMQKALEAFKARHSRYPSTCTAVGAVSCDISASNWRGSCSLYPGGNNYIPGLAPEFIPILPHDPREERSNPERSGGSAVSNGSCAIAGRNCYLYRSNGSDYKLLAHCTPEDELSSEDPFYDPARQSVVGSTTYRWAWQVSSSSVTRTW